MVKEEGVQSKVPQDPTLTTRSTTTTTGSGDRNLKVAKDFLIMWLVLSNWTAAVSRLLFSSEETTTLGYDAAASKFQECTNIAAVTLYVVIILIHVARLVQQSSFLRSLANVCCFLVSSFLRSLANVYRFFYRRWSDFFLFFQSIFPQYPTLRTTTRDRNLMVAKSLLKLLVVGWQLTAVCILLFACKETNTTFSYDLPALDLLAYANIAASIPDLLINCFFSHIHFAECVLSLLSLNITVCYFIYRLGSGFFLFFLFDLVIMAFVIGHAASRPGVDELIAERKKVRGEEEEEVVVEEEEQILNNQLFFPL